MSELIPTTPENHPTSVETWTPLETGLVVPINSVHLGRIVNQNGGVVYKDEARTSVNKAGIDFMVAQSSAGFTGMYVIPTKGHTVSILTINPETKKADWVKPAGDDPQILVSGDSGQLVNNPNILKVKWDSDTRFGEAGIHAGVIKVTDTEGQTRYYGLAADFAGREDNWEVTGKIVELEPKNELGAPTPKPLEP